LYHVEFETPFHHDFGPHWTFILFFGIISVLFLMIILKRIHTWMTNNASPILTAPAMVISKRQKVTGGGNDSSVSTYSYITFQLENGERMEFRVTGSEYGLLIETDHGFLTYQGSRYKGFDRKSTFIN